jgi:hypothetical protein
MKLPSDLAPFGYGLLFDFHPGAGKTTFLFYFLESRVQRWPTRRLQAREAIKNIGRRYMPQELDNIEAAGRENKVENHNPYKTNRVFHDGFFEPFLRSFYGPFFIEAEKTFWKKTCVF